MNWRDARHTKDDSVSTKIDSFIKEVSDDEANTELLKVLLNKLAEHLIVFPNIHYTHYRYILAKWTIGTWEVELKSNC